MNVAGHALPPGIDLGAVALAIEASLLSESLHAFSVSAWHVLEPATSFQDNWHLKAICEHLEAVSRGEIQNLIVNVPPRSMKSLLISVLWPAWEWTWRPTRRWLYASYGKALATRDALKTRRLIQSAWYQARWGKGTLWPNAYALTGDQNEKTRYENDRLGYRLSTSVGGLGTGEGGDIIVVDDPHNVEEAESEAVRASTLTWWFETMSSRGNDPTNVVKVIVMQRVHELDLTAACLAKGGYEHLCLPMEFERDHPTKSATSLGFKDPRKKEGELLWPSRFTPKALQQLKTSLGEYGTAGQLQQRPSPRGGGMFKSKFLKLFPKERLLPPMQFVLQSYDTAFTEQTTNDPCACTVWGIWADAKGVNNALLLDAWDEHLNYAKLRKRVTKDWKERYGVRDDDPLNPGRRADALLVENKGSGISIIQELRSANVPAQKYNPGDADKVARGERILPIYELGVIWILESAEPLEERAKAGEHGKFISWARPFVKQVTTFGPATSGHDDYVDTLTQAMIYLRDAGWLDLPGVEEDPPESLPYGPKPRNPYD